MFIPAYSGELCTDEEGVENSVIAADQLLNLNAGDKLRLCGVVGEEFVDICSDPVEVTEAAAE